MYEQRLNILYNIDNFQIEFMVREEDETLQELKRDMDEQNLSDSRSDIEIRKKQPRDHTSNVGHSQLVKQSEYRKCIPVRQRVGNWFYNRFRCSDPDSSYVDKLNKFQIKHPAQLSEQYKRILKDKILKMKIIQTSRLELDSNVIHPFVKVHIIDKNNGCYIQKRHEQLDTMIYHNQSITFYDNVTRKYDTSQNNIILPFSTTMCDFREMGNSIGRWNQKFFINYPADRLINPDTIFLFEILDFNHQALMYKDTDIYDKDNFYRIAWGYLRPVGMGKTHIGISKIQLYKYKFNNKKAADSLTKPFIPSVYYDFLWSNHEKYEGYLTVQLTYVSSPKYKFLDQDAEYPQNLFEDYRPDPTFIKRHHRENPIEQQQIQKHNIDLLRFYRNQNRCEIPQSFIYKLESNKLGCYRTLFIGNYLFAACSSKKYTNIKVFSLEKGEKVMTIKGHRQMIYSLKSTANEKYLISAGSDHIARVWEVPNNYGQYIDEDESQRYLKGECVHSAAVYCTSSIHTPINNKLHLVTCCYDGYIRLWDVDLATHQTYIVKQFLINTYQRSSNKVYPTASVVSQSNFFIGDSIGDIRIYDFSRQTLNLRCHIVTQQLKNDEVLCIKVLNKNNVLIQASDNLVWHFQLSGNRMRMMQKFSGAQFQSKLADCAVSPDNKYLLAPSQTGKPFMWDLFTGASISLDHLNLEIKGPLVSCSWHPLYNLVAFGGFVQLCPVMVYGNVLSQSEQKMVAAQIQ